jgi:hypothetical protein
MKGHMNKPKADPKRVAEARFLFKESMTRLEKQNEESQDAPMARDYMVRKSFETLHMNGYTKLEAVTMLAEMLVQSHAGRRA